MLGCVFTIFRSVASLILGLVIFFGLLVFLVERNVRDNFLTAEFYTESLSENDAYNRIYDEVLLDPEFEDTTDDLLGDIDISQEDIAGVARDIIPPDYLQDQVEGAVRGVIDYLNKETDTPKVFIDLGPPLEGAKPALFRYIDGRIDELEEVPVDTLEELEEELEDLYRVLETGDVPTRVPSIANRQVLVDNYVDQTIAKLDEVPVSTGREFRQEVEDIYQELAAGELPTRIPSIEAIPVSDRLIAYDQALQFLDDQSLIPEETIKGLKDREEDIKRELSKEKGAVKGALKVASPKLTEPVMNKFVDDAYDLAYQALVDEGFPQKALDGLDERQDAIKEHLGEGEIKESLKLGARGLAGPLIDEALEELRKELDEQDRLDLVSIAAEQNNQTEEDFLDDLDIVRSSIEQGKIGSWLAILMMVGGAVLMALVHLPHLGSGLRWPGLTLCLSGSVFLIIGLVLKSQLPGQFDDLLNQGTSPASLIPPTMIDIIGDVLGSLATDVAGGLIAPSIVMMVIGVVLLVGSFFIRLLHIPFLSR